MPLQNRVTPFSELVAHPARGLLYGNRGCMHDDTGRICRRYGTRRWIACRLEFRGWERGPKLQPGKFTELFFLDEVTAFAAGHRPCALCRRADYVRLTRALERPAPRPGRSRRDRPPAPRRARRARLARATAPRGAPSAISPTARSCWRDGAAWLVLGPRLLRWTPAGYAERRPRPRNGHRDRDHTALAGGRPALGLAAARAARASLIRGLRRSGSVRIGLSRQVSVNKRVTSASVARGRWYSWERRFFPRMQSGGTA